MKKILLYIFLQSFLVGMLIVPIRGYAFAWSSLVGFVVYYVYTWFALRRYATQVPLKHIAWAIFIGLGILEIPFRAFYFSSSVISLPDLLLKILGFLIAYIGFKTTKGVRLALLGVGLALNVWMSFPLFHHLSGWEMWMHKQETGHFLPFADNRKLSAEIWENAYNEAGETLNAFRGHKITLIDFWTDGCGYCWRGFPGIQRLYDQYRNHPDVYICSVYTLYHEGEDASTPRQLLDKRGYTFPVFCTPKDSPLLQELSIDAYPRTILLNAEGELVLDFSGSKEELLKEEIEKLLEDK